MKEKILFVDDDANILDAFKRQLRYEYDVEVAYTGMEGLVLIETNGPFSVIVSDLHMPGMNGIDFLSEVRDIAPTSVRMILTGNADLGTAIDAVNDGYIFRFLIKPCSPETLIKALEGGVAQYHLIISERELLEKTLVGSVKVLTELLSMINPLAFSRAERIREIVKQIVATLHLEDGWSFELAALLSQIGCVTFPPDLIERIMEGGYISVEEKNLYATHPSIGRRLLENIPRLELVGEMIEKQLASIEELAPEDKEGDEFSVALGAHILYVANDLDQLLQDGVLKDAAIETMKNRSDRYMPEVLGALIPLAPRTRTKMVKVEDLDVGMIIIQDVKDKFGRRLVSHGQEVTYPLLTKLFGLAQRKGYIQEPICVVSPRSIG
jgi:response regulator RpfG family c-di-GMP phosphodiesterase